MRTPPISTAAFASRGKPPLSWPMSLVVPPTSTTIASCAPERNAAPRMLLVGPEAKQCTGKRRASSARAMVPSFRVRYSGAGRPVRRSAPSRAAIVLAASSCKQAFSAAAFSRSSSPMRPSSCDRVTRTPGTSSRRIRSASSSQSGTNGEKTALTATEAMPASAMRRAASRTAPRSIGTIGRPSHSWPPRTMCTWPRTASARSAGQSTKGGRLAPVGSPMRSTATFCRPRRWTTALVNCVVPTTTASAEHASGAALIRSVSAVSTPDSTSSVVGVFTDASTRVLSTNAASVLVPPTSIPMRLMPGPR